MSRPETVDEYIEAFPPLARTRLGELREVSRRAAPNAIEGLKWGDPAYSDEQGTILFLFSGFSRHANFVFTPSTRRAFDEELTELGTGKGSVKLPYDAATPVDLLTRMVEYRVREFEIEGVKWK